MANEFTVINPDKIIKIAQKLGSKGGYILQIPSWPRGTK